MSDEHMADDARLAQRIRRLTQACLPGAIEPTQEAAALRQLQTRARRRGPVRVWWAWAVAVPAAVAVAAFALFVNQPLSFVIEGGAVVAGAVAPHAPQTRIAFSDGSEMVLPEHTRTRIAGIDARGAQLVVDEGTARVSVRRRLRARWSVEAGPYHVAVHGTLFDVAWTPQQARFTLALHEGAVTIEGPMAEAGIALRAGQRLVAEPRTGHLEVQSIEAEEVHAPAPPPAAAGNEEGAQTAVPQEAPQAATPRAPRPRRPQPPEWADLVAAGKPQLVLEDARRVGLPKVLAHRDARSLMQLADAGRFVGARDVSRAALQATRTRFPRAAEATTAAFLLGRLAEEEGVDANRALQWYDTYLQEASVGTMAGASASFVPQALGRKMLLVHRTAGAAAACIVARKYLAAAPAGPYAKAAAEVCRHAR